MSTSISFEVVAKIAFAALQEYCKTIGDLKPNWDALTDTEKQGYIDLVATIVSTQGTTPETMFGSNEGYMKLPRSVRLKDYIFFNVVGAMLAN
jgi:hypothetical protein